MSLFQPTRRQLLVAGLGAVAAGGGLVLGARLWRSRARYRPVPPRDEPFAPVAYLAVTTDDVVRIWLARAEFGQGVMTALPMLVADELRADWSRVEVVLAEARPEYGSMLTAVSESVRGSWSELRTSGAAAREMLVGAAADRWGVDPDRCAVEASVVTGPGGERATFGELAEAAAGRALPIWPRLLPPEARSLVGTSPPRVDIPDKTTGKARFGLDVQVPGLRHAVLARPRPFGARVAGFDPAPALAVPGVEAVHALPTGVAVVARHTHAAIQGARALTLEVEPGPLAELDSAAIDARLEEAARNSGLEVRREGSGHGTRLVEATYRTPLLAHATLEPMTCTARVDDQGIELWAPTQAADVLQSSAGGWVDRPEAPVRVHPTLIGGAFGRRVQTDFAEEAVRLAALVGHPVKVTFTREDDTRHDFYRPPALHVLRGTLDDDGWPRSWIHRIVSPSILGQADPAYAEVDPVAVEGADHPYAIPHVDIAYRNVHLGIPLGFWRSVGHSHTAFAVETFLDELARAGEKDPVALRRRLLRDAPRHLRVLEVAAERAGWGAPLPPGRARGVAVHACYGSWVAEVAEVELEGDVLRVHRVVAAVDAGWVVHPDTVVAQMEGGIVFGLTAALHGAVHLEGGAVRESNFHDYPLLRLDRTPEIEVHLVGTDAHAPGGVGEIAVPPIAPAVANAVLALTGTPVRALPIDPGRGWG